MNAHLPTVECIADLNKIVTARAAEGALRVGLIARWTSGEMVSVCGRFQSRGWTHDIASPGTSIIRWRTDGVSKGLFAKGLVDVATGHPEVPVVK